MEEEEGFLGPFKGIDPPRPPEALLSQSLSENVTTILLIPFLPLLLVLHIAIPIIILILLLRHT